MSFIYCQFTRLLPILCETTETRLNCMLLTVGEIPLSRVTLCANSAFKTYLFLLLMSSTIYDFTKDLITRNGLEIVHISFEKHAENSRTRHAWNFVYHAIKPSAFPIFASTCILNNFTQQYIIVALENPTMHFFHKVKIFVSTCPEFQF